MSQAEPQKLNGSPGSPGPPLTIEDVIGKYKSSRQGGGLVVVTHDKAKDLVTIVNAGKPTWEKVRRVMYTYV